MSVYLCALRTPQPTVAWSRHRETLAAATTNPGCETTTTTTTTTTRQRQQRHRRHYKTGVSVPGESVFLVQGGRREVAGSEW